MPTNDTDNKLTEDMLCKICMRTWAQLADSKGFCNADYYFDIIMLHAAMRRCWFDVLNVKNFHKITLPDVHKYAGYSTYWISKLHPVSVCTKSAHAKNTKTATYINEIYSILVGKAILNWYNENIAKKPVCESPIDQSLAKSLRYTLRYRTTSRDFLSTVFYFLEKTAT